jgi:DNA-binding transcriptional MerR regulator
MLSKYKTKPEILWVPSQIATALLKHKKDTGFSLKDIYGAESCNWSYVIDTDKKTAEIFKVEDDSGNVKYLNVLSCYLNSDLSIEDCKKICGKLKKPKIQLKPKKEAGTEVKRGSTSTNAAKPLKSAASKTTNKTASKTKVAKPRA